MRHSPQTIRAVFFPVFLCTSLDFNCIFEIWILPIGPGALLGQLSLCHQLLPSSELLSLGDNSGPPLVASLTLGTWGKLEVELAVPGWRFQIFWLTVDASKILANQLRCGILLET